MPTIEKDPAMTGELVTTSTPHPPARKRPAKPADATLMFERLAKDPSVDVEKLERLIAMQERIMKHQAKAEFDAAFAEMQGEIPVITERGQIIVKGELRSKYATNEDIQEAVKPILQAHGFSLRFRNEVDGNRIKVIGILSHRSGHSEQDEFVAGVDDSGAKNNIQGIGSTRSYGQRYTTTALLNIATRGEDDDGRAAGRKAPPPEATIPESYEEWFTDMSALADEGWPSVAAAWKLSKPEYRDYATKHDKVRWKALKARAEQVKRHEVQHHRRISAVS